VSDHRPPPPPPPPPGPPPAFGPPTGPPAESSGPQVRKVSGLGSALVILTSIVGVSALLSGITQAGARSDARNFLDGVISEEEFLEAYSSASGAGALASAGQIAIAILTFTMMFKMARNLRDAGRDTRWGPPWAIAGWVLPPGVLYLIPWLMFRELWKASDPNVADGSDWRSTADPVPVSFTLWWVFFGLAPIPFATLLGVSVVDAGLMANDTRALATILAEQYWVTFASSVATAIAAVAYVIMIRSLTSRHRHFTGELTGSR